MGWRRSAVAALALIIAVPARAQAPEIAMVIRLHHTMKVGEVVHPIAAMILLAEAIVKQFPDRFGG